MSPETMPLLPDGTAPGVVAALFPAANVPDPEDQPGPGSGGPPLPLNIGHRGFKAAFPENSMAAFHGAVAAGAHAIETDLHLSRDGVVVLSHDASLKRCFGVDAKVADCDWSYLRTLETLRTPRQGMPRLVDLLRWLAQPELDSVWVLLDVKTDDDAEQMLAAVAMTLASVPPAPGGRPWKERVAIGCWNEHYITLTRHLLPSHPIFLIAFSVLQAHKFLSPPSSSSSSSSSCSKHDASQDPNSDVHFNIFQPALVGPLGARFRRAARRRGRRLLAWTVNDAGWMDWCVRKGVDGVITDEVARFERICRGVGGGDEDGTDSGSDGDEADKGGMAVVARKGGDGRVGVGWRRWAHMYVKAGLLQAAAMLLVLVFRRRLRDRGKGGKGGKVHALSKIAGKV